MSMFKSFFNGIVSFCKKAYNTIKKHFTTMVLGVTCAALGFRLVKTEFRNCQLLGTIARMKNEYDKLKDNMKNTIADNALLLSEYIQLRNDKARLIELYYNGY